MIGYVGFGDIAKGLFDKLDLDNVIYGVRSAEEMSIWTHGFLYYPPETNNSRRYRGLKPLRTNRAKLASK